MKILVTAFDPFGGASLNPAWEAVSRIPEEWDGAQVARLQVPTVFGDAERAALAEAERISADIILCIGQAGGRSSISVERVAINLDDAPIPDNRGNQPIDRPISENGAPAYFSSIPVKEIAEAIRQAGVPAELSCTAGTYVCNHLLYRVLEDSALHHPDRKCGFLHVPYLPEQVIHQSRTPSMSLDTILKGLKAALAAIIRCC